MEGPQGPDGSVRLPLTPLELIERLAALIPPPCRHRHRYYGVLAPNAPLRAAVTALAVAEDEVPATVAIVEANQSDVDPEPLSPNAARYVWALLLARLYEVLPLV